MSIEKNIQTVKDFFAAIGSGDRESLLALVSEDIEWIIPGKDWPLAGTHRGTRRVDGPACDGIQVDRNLHGTPRVRSARKPGSGRRLCEGQDQSHEQVVRGRLDFRDHGPGRQADEHP